MCLLIGFDGTDVIYYLLLQNKMWVLIISCWLCLMFGIFINLYV